MSGCASAPASRQPTGRAFSGPCPHSRRTCLDGNTTRSLEVSLKDTDGPDQKVTLQAWLGGRAHLLATSHERDLDHALAEVRRPDPPDRGREVAARTSQAPEDPLSHDLTRARIRRRPVSRSRRGPGGGRPTDHRCTAAPPLPGVLHFRRKRGPVSGNGKGTSESAVYKAVDSRTLMLLGHAVVKASATYSRMG